METFLFFQLRFPRVYDSAYDSDIRFSLGHELSYDSDSVASENHPLLIVSRTLKFPSESRVKGFGFIF